MKSYFCPCILVGQNHARIHKNEPKADACSGWCCGWCGLTSCLGLGWILQMMDRMEMQDKYGMSIVLPCPLCVLGRGKEGDKKRLLMKYVDRSRRWWLWCLLQVLLVWLLFEYSDGEGVGLYTVEATGRWVCCWPADGCAAAVSGLSEEGVACRSRD